MWSTGVLEHWSVGRKGLQNYSSGIQEKWHFPRSQCVSRVLFIAFTILHYSSAPILPQKDGDIPPLSE